MVPTESHKLKAIFSHISLKVQLMVFRRETGMDRFGRVIKLSFLKTRASLEIAYYSEELDTRREAIRLCPIALTWKIKPEWPNWQQTIETLLIFIRGSSMCLLWPKDGNDPLKDP